MGRMGEKGLVEGRKKRERNERKNRKRNWKRNWMREVKRIEREEREQSMIKSDKEK